MQKIEPTKYRSVTYGAVISGKVLYQKINYLHHIPVKAGLCISSEDCSYSSAKFYKMGIDDFTMPTHFEG